MPFAVEIKPVITQLNNHLINIRGGWPYISVILIYILDNNNIP